MEAGRELDALIGEHIIGKDVVWQHWCGEETAEPYFADAKGCDDGGLVPLYSTDIAATWEVVKRLESEGIAIEVSSPGSYSDEGLGPSETWSGWFFWEGLHHYDCAGADGDNAPHAICLAALKAKGIEIPDE